MYSEVGRGVFQCEERALVGKFQLSQPLLITGTLRLCNSQFLVENRFSREAIIFSPVRDPELGTSWRRQAVFVVQGVPVI